MPRKSVLAICGGGNAGHALAIVASQHFNGDVAWLAGSEDKAEVLRRGVFSPEGLRSTGSVVGMAHRVRFISADPANIIPHADIVLIAVPAFAHAAVLQQIAPHLKETVLIGSLPSRSGFEFEAMQFIPGLGADGGRVLFGLQTLPWSTRTQEPGKLVNFGCTKAQVLMATLPARHAPDVAAQLSRLFGTQIVPTANFLNMTLGNPGQVIHPGLMFGLFSDWSGRTYREDEIPFFYARTTDESGAFVEQLSADLTNLAREIHRKSAGTLDLSGVLSIHDWLRISYPAQTRDTSTAASCFRTGPLQQRKAPMLPCPDGSYAPNFEYRYLTEDVPFGLAVSKAIAQLADVDTPAIDRLLHWAETQLGVRFAMDRLPIPQNFGIHSVGALIDWYAADGAALQTGHVVA